MNTLKAFFKTPDTIEEDKKLYDEYDLHYYTPGEELLNAISHGLGIPFAIAGLVLMLLKSTSPMSYVVSVLCSLGFLVLYVNSTVYHATKSLKAKSVMRRIDYCSVNLIVIACGTGLSLLSGKTAGYAIYGVCFVLTAVSVILCIANFRKFRLLAFAMNFVIGALLFSSYFITDFSMPDVALWLNLGGIISVLLGAAIFGIHVRYMHVLFHFFTLVGPILFWTANYVLLV